MKEFTVNLKTLTPLWTGDANGKCDDLKESGIIGSLRWWYEALLRGLGSNVHDPTDESSRCKLDQKKFQEDINSGKSVLDALKEQNICPACQLFGCSGWARKFRLEISFRETSFNYTIPEVWIGTREKRNNRYLKRKVGGFMPNGSIVLTFIPLKDISKKEWVLLNSTLKVIEDYGAIGAHTSQGNGVIKIVENNLPYKNEKCKDIQFDKSKNSLPSLDKFFFYKFKLEFKEDISKLINNNSFWTHAQENNQFRDNWDNWRELWENYNFLPTTFHIRDSIRHLENDWKKRHEIFGELGKGSKVFVSHGYKIDNNDDKNVEVRIWGYEINNSLLSQIKNNLESNLKQNLFSGGEDLLKNCSLKEEKTGESLINQLVEELI